MGLIIGVELKGRVTPVLRGLMERGVMALPAGNTVLRFLPPLSISREEIDQVVEAVDAVLGSLEKTSPDRQNRPDRPDRPDRPARAGRKAVNRSRAGLGQVEAREAE